MTITRRCHPFEGQALAVISSIKRRGVLLVLVIVPNGSRSLIPAAWTDWREAQGNASPGDDDIDDAVSLGRLGDLLQLRSIIDALQCRQSESAPHTESLHAVEPRVSGPAATVDRSHTVEPSGEHTGSRPAHGLEPDRRSRSGRRPRAAGHPDRTPVGSRGHNVNDRDGGRS